MANWNTSGAKVFDGGCPTSFTDLDLTQDSGGGDTGLPAAQVLAILRVESKAGGLYIGFRPNGDSADWYVTRNYSQGTCVGVTHASPYVGSLLIAVPTDASGVCEWKANGSSAKVYLVGWIQCTFSGTQVFSGSMATSWTDLDVDAVVSGSDEALLFLKYLRSGGTADFCAARLNGDTSDYIDVTGKGGVNAAELYETTIARGMLVDSDSSGVIEHRSTTVVPEATVDLLCYEKTGWYPIAETVFASATPPTSYTDLDLSEHVGTDTALVFLKVTRAATGSGTYVDVGCRTNGSSVEFILSNVWASGCGSCRIDASKSAIICGETDSNGVIEWRSSSGSYDIAVELVGFIATNDPPTFTGRAPTGSSVVYDDDVEITVLSGGVQIDSDTIDLDLTDPDSNQVNAIVNGVFQSGYSGTITDDGSNGYDVAVATHPVLTAGTWQVDVFASDGSRDGTDTWTFTVPPVEVTMAENSPTGDNAVERDPITFAATHTSGVTENTLALTLVDPKGTSHSPLAAGVFDYTNGWSGRVIADGTGFDVVVDIHDPFIPGPWTATATANTDAGTEEGSVSWTFTVVSIVAGILQHIVDLLEGSEGSTRTVPTGTFHHIDFSHEDVGALGAAGPSRPFDLRIIGSVDDGSLPAFVSGDFVQDAHQIRLSVVYSMRPQAALAMEKSIANDSYFIRRSLEWPENWCLISGWTGCEITGVSTEEISEGDTIQIVVVHYDLTIGIREKHQ